MQNHELIHTPNGGIKRLLHIMECLRDPDTGCPWDIEQTFDSIAPYTIEEAYEVADAIARNDVHDLKSELGDLLLQTVYHTQIGTEAGHFTFDDVADAIAQKMLDRHPHVFGDQCRDKSAEQQKKDWETIKAAEREKRGEAGVLDGVALGLPALLRAQKLQKRAARVGFDWPETTQVLDKLTEEAAELVDAAADKDADAIEDEMGDLLFVMANLARHLGVDPEAALRRTNTKFTTRFAWIEAELAKAGKSPEDSTLDEMDGLWNAAKLALRAQKAKGA